MSPRPEPAWKKALGCLLVPFVPLLVLLIPILNALGLNKTRAGRERIIKYLSGFIEDDYGEWDWDDFCSVPFADPKLDDIRERACRYEPPWKLTDEDRDELRRLLDEARDFQAKRD